MTKPEPLVRLQVQLTRRQHSALKKASRRTGRSVASLVRDAVEQQLTAAEAQPDIARALALIGAFEADRDDIAGDHDRYFAEAAGAHR